MENRSSVSRLGFYCIGRVAGYVTALLKRSSQPLHDMTNEHELTTAFLDVDVKSSIVKPKRRRAGSPPAASYDMRLRKKKSESPLECNNDIEMVSTRSLTPERNERVMKTRSVMAQSEGKDVSRRIWTSKYESYMKPGDTNRSSSNKASPKKRKFSRGSSSPSAPAQGSSGLIIRKVDNNPIQKKDFVLRTILRSSKKAVKCHHVFEVSQRCLIHKLSLTAMPPEDGAMSEKFSNNAMDIRYQEYDTLVTDTFVQYSITEQNMFKQTVSLTYTQEMAKKPIKILPDSLVTKIVGRIKKNARDLDAMRVIKRIPTSSGSLMVVAPSDGSPYATLPNYVHINKNDASNISISADPRVPCCGSECVKGCSNSCPCMMASIIAGRSFLYKGYVITDMVSGMASPNCYWQVGVNTCSKNCSCGGNCSHGEKQLSCSKTYRLRFINETMGFGLFAKEDIPAGKIVLEFTGLLKDEAPENKEERDYAWNTCNVRGDEVASSFSFYWDVKCKARNIYIDPKHCGNEGRFVNHSENPNLLSIRVLSNDPRSEKARLFFFAAKDIPKGAELLVDYGGDYVKEQLKGLKCQCRAPVCTANSDLQGYSKKDIKYILTEVEERTRKLIDPNRRFAATFNSWSESDQDLFIYFSRALKARFPYFVKQNKALIEAYRNDYIRNPQPLFWTDKNLSKDNKLVLKDSVHRANG